MYYEDEWEECSESTQIEDSDDCECFIKYCCIDFKTDFQKGNRRTIAQVVLKLVILLLTILIVFSTISRFKSYHREYVLREYMQRFPKKFPTTTPSPDKIYSSNDSDLQSRSLPNWYQKAKIGITINWGLYSVPGYGVYSEDFWFSSRISRDCQQFVNNTYGKQFKYPNLAQKFTAESFNPDYWAKLFAKSGAKYVILTCKGNDGYALFPSDQSIGWDSVQTGPGRDLVGEIATAVRQYGLEFGVHYALYEWYNPLLMLDSKVNFTSARYSNEKLWPDLLKLINNYHPLLVSVDGMPHIDKAFLNDFLSWLYTHAPVKKDVVAAELNIDTEIRNAMGEFRFPRSWKQGDDYVRHSIIEKVILLDKASIGYRHVSDVTEIVTTKEMLFLIMNDVALGSNVAINISPTSEGIIPLIYQKRLLEMGKWLKLNGEAVYGTVPWKRPKDEITWGVFYTCTVSQLIKKIDYEDPMALLKLITEEHEDEKTVMSSLYVTFFKWPRNGRLRLRYVAHLFVNNTYQVEFLGKPSKYWNWTIFQNGAYREIEIQLPGRTTVSSKHAWVLKITLKPVDNNQDENVKIRPNASNVAKKVGWIDHSHNDHKNNDSFPNNSNTSHYNNSQYLSKLPNDK